MPSLAVALAALFLIAPSQLSALEEQTAMQKRLFPTDLPESEWVEFAAAGFSQPVSGVIYRSGKPPCCGVPLGGISTGCLDIEASGVLGYSSIFNPASGGDPSKNRIPRIPPTYQPFLGLSLEGKTWILAAQRMLDGGEVPVCTDPVFAGRQDWLRLPKIEGVEAAKEIHYWGHYPVADLEYDLDAPLSIGLRAWAPFLPGDTAASNIPGAIFEVHLRNATAQAQQGTLAFSFPGPSVSEANATEFLRWGLEEEHFVGVMVSTGEGVGYFLGVMGRGEVRIGGGLGSDGQAWASIAYDLPQPASRERSGLPAYREPGCSLAVDFALEPGEERVTRFLLTWYAPEWEGADGNRYTHMYASRYRSALEVARRLAHDHESLLGRVLAWQQEIYASADLPVWLRDTLVNNLALIPECSYWAMAEPPLGDWCHPGGFFGLLESPRGCPQIECIPCSWYGNLPIVYFFPELAWTTLKGYKQYQREDGAAPFLIGRWGLPDMASPSWEWQKSLNGMCYVDLVDRLWLRTRDDAVLHEFYDSVKRATVFTIDLRPGPEGVISMPAGNEGMEWFERGEWLGMCSHLGGLHLSMVRVAQRMAEAMGDGEFADQCRQWLEQGSNAMEGKMWAGSYYLNYYDPETGKKSDDVMGYQLDGEWAAVSHGLPGVFREDRIKATLATIKRCNVALTPDCGAANFARPDGTPLPSDEKVAEYGAYAMFPPEVLVLAMTYVYAGERDFGLELARRNMHNQVCKQRIPWDLTNMVRGDTGERIYGTDYYQNMMLWALPAALEGEDLRAPCEFGGLVERVIRAATPQTL